MIRLPINKKWTQTNRGDTGHISPYSSLQGLNTLAASFNLDLTTNLGRTRITKLLKTSDDTSDATLGDVPVAFRYFYYVSTPHIFTVGGTFVHANAGDTQDGFSKFTTASGYPTSCSSSYSDMEIANGFLYVTQSDQGVYYLDPAISGTWHSFNMTGSGSDANNPHMLCAYAGRMYGTYGNNKIASWDSSNSAVQPSAVGAANTVQYTLQLDPSLNIYWMRSSATGIWIGVGSLQSQSFSRAQILFWDGSSSQAKSSYKLEAAAPLACVIKDDVPFVLDSNGRFVNFNGGTFKEVARFPYFEKWPYGTNVLQNDGRCIHPNGITLNNGRINILLKNTLYENGSPTPEFMPSGVWEYDESIGLYHKYSPSYTDTSTYTQNDYGQFTVSKVGALSEMKSPDTTTASNGRFLAGLRVAIPNGSGSLSTTDGVFTDETAVTSSQIGGNTNATQKAGYLVTIKADSQNVTDIWQKLFIKFKQLLNSTDRIVGKYRTTEAIPTIISNVTWTSTTTFTTADSNMGNYAVGDEVEFIAGRAAGMCAHITTIALNAGTYTVTIDETAATSDGTNYNKSNIRLQKWIKMGADINDQIRQYHERSIGGNDSTWIQFKVWMLWTGNNELDELVVASIPGVSANIKV